MIGLIFSCFLNLFGYIIGLIFSCFLKLLGFGAAGIIKGSLAAFWQSYLGFVSAGTIFAFLTSFAMRRGSGGLSIICLFIGIGVLLYLMRTLN